MAKVIRIEGCQTVIRVDRICAVDRRKETEGWVVRIFIIGCSDGYHLSCGNYEEASEKLYNDIIKVMEED